MHAPGDHVVVFDNLGVEFGPSPTFRLDPGGLTAQISRFMRSVGLVVRDLHRGDFRLCCFAVEFLVDELVTLMDQSQGLARAERRAPTSICRTWRSTCSKPFPSPSRSDSRIIDAHLAVAEAYLLRARKLAATSGAEWPSAMEEATRRFLMTEVVVDFSADRSMASGAGVPRLCVGRRHQVCDADLTRRQTTMAVDTRPDK